MAILAVHKHHASGRYTHKELVENQIGTGHSWGEEEDSYRFSLTLRDTSRPTTQHYRLDLTLEEAKILYQTLGDRLAEAPAYRGGKLYREPPFPIGQRQREG